MIGRGLLVLGLLASLPATGVAQDSERLYQEACDGGDMIACNVFGLMYEYGDGVERDATRAAALYERACEGGELVGCTNLGLLFEMGVGVERDRDRALGLYRVSCEGGELLGCQRAAPGTGAGGLRPTQRHFKAGRVGDDDSGEPLAGVLIEIASLGIQVFSDAEGRFRLPDMPAGIHPLTAQHLGYDILEGELPVPGRPDFLILMTKYDMPNPDDPGRVVGRVLEEGGQPLSDVEITVLGQERARTLSNQDGRFTLRNVAPGLTEVRFTHLGYAPRTATLVVQPDRTFEVATTMVIQPIELEPVQVTVRSSFLEQTGFYARADRGAGTHFTPQEIDLLATESVADVIRGRVPGVRITYGNFVPISPDPSTGPVGPGMAMAVSRSRGQTCILSIYVDGIETRELDIATFPPQDIAAIEVYEGRLETPPQYMANPCGAILLWTRRGA